MNACFYRPWKTLDILCRPVKFGCIGQVTKGDVGCRSKLFNNFCVIRKTGMVHERLFKTLSCHSCHVRMKVSQSCLPNNYMNYVTVSPSLTIAGAEKNNSGLDFEKPVSYLVDSIIEKASEKDIMVRSIPKRRLAQELGNLLKAGFPPDRVDLFVKYPKLLKNIPQIESLQNLMKDLGFEMQDINSILQSYPKVFMIEQNKWMAVCEILQGHGFSFDDVVKMIKEYPKILVSNLDHIEGRVDELKALFKTKDALNLLVNSPELLFIDFEEISLKFKYVFHEMGVTQPQMRHANVFTYSIDHIQARHMFVVRAGFFKKVKRKQGQIDMNPRLDAIIDSSDDDFVKQFGDMTMQDYHTFKKLLQEEKVYLTEIEDE